MIIKYNCYKYAPETARVFVNGERLNVSNTMIPQYIATGNKEKAIQEIKKQYRKEAAKEQKYIYAFFAKNSKQFYYIAVLNFSEKADLQTRLYCYKELKHHLINNPMEIKTESGYFTPDGATKPETKTEKVELDFSRIAKIKIA